MAIFTAERHPGGVPTKLDIAVYLACPQCACWYIQNSEYGHVPFLFHVDHGALLGFRYDVFRKAYLGTLDALKEEGGMAHPDKIPEIVSDSYSDAKTYAGYRRKKLKEMHERWLHERKKLTFKRNGVFLNKSVEYTNVALSGREKLIQKLSEESRKNYEGRHNLIAAVEEWGELEGNDDVTGRPSLIIAYRNPNMIELMKLKGGNFTQDYLKQWFYVDQAKLAMDYYLFRETPKTLEQARELFGLPEPRSDWDLTETDIELKDELQILSSGIESRAFRTSGFRLEIEKAREELETFMDSKSKDGLWKDKPHKEDTCPMFHPRAASQ